MGLEDSGRRREGPSRGPHSILHAAGLRSSTLRPSRGFLEGGRGVDGPEEAQAAGPRLDELKRRLVRAFQRAVLRGSSRRLRLEAAPGLGSDMSGLAAPLCHQGLPWQLRW